ncbi:MAG: hypothetical protein SGILL_009160, partial [Bacillariaceae sp.]
PPPTAPPESRVIGFFVCIHCSAAHRKLGDEICVVKSPKLDAWTDDEIASVARGGNLRINTIFEGTLFDDTAKPTPLVDAAVRERFIRDKYFHHKYLVVKAYSCVGTEEEDEDDSIIDDALTATNTISALSHSTAFAKQTLPSIAEAPPRLATLLMTPTTTARPSLMSMYRQASLPEMKHSLTPSLATPGAIKVSTALSLKKIASPFRKENDFWESMNNSTWGDMTFDDSLHRSQRGSRGDRKRGMPKKALSERALSTSANDLLSRTPAASKAEKKKKLDRSALMSQPKCVSDRALLSSRPKPDRHHSLGSPKRRNKKESHSSSPTKKGKIKVLSVLDLLEEKNRNRKRSDRKPRRHASEPIKDIQNMKLMRPPRQHSDPANGIRRALSLRDVGQPTQTGHPSRTKTLRALLETPETKNKGKSRSLSPKSHKRAKGETGGRIRTSSRNGRKQRSSGQSPSPLVRSSSLGKTSRQVELKRQQFLKKETQGSDSSGLSGSSKASSRRSSSADTAKARRRRHAVTAPIGGSEHPPVITSNGTPGTPRSRKALKHKTPKTPLVGKSESLACPDSAPATRPLERSLSSRKNRPRSLSEGRKSRLRRKHRNDELGSATEHKEGGAFQHPLFACPMTSTQ